MKKDDPRLIGFLIGFASVFVIGLLAMIGLGIFRVSPSPTPAPGAAPIAEYTTAIPSAADTTVPPSTVRQASTPTSSAAPVEPSPSPTRSEPIQYTVRAGDTLFDISLAYGVSVETIRAANDLQGETIVPGQVLTIPPGPLPTATPYVEGGTLVHTVSSGETLIGIAAHYSVTVENIQQANDLDSETIQPGWQLRIPGADIEPVVASPSSPTRDTDWIPAILEGDLTDGYPLTLERERFTMHYQPNTPAARVPGFVARQIESALDHIEDKLQVNLQGGFDVYISGSLFAPDDTALRGRSFSSQRRSFLLYDGTGTRDEWRYFVTHELTHLVTWHTLGKPSSVMLHEGASVYTGIEAMEQAGFLPLNHFCAAYHVAGQLPDLSEDRAYLGHLHDLALYFSAGCFVQYLIQTQDLEDFKQLFTSDDYPGIYGYTLSQLQAEWIETLDSIGDDLPFVPQDLVSSVTEVAAAYDRLFADFNGTSSQMDAYRELDRARIALLQGRFDETQEHLSQFEKLLQGP